MTQGMDMNYFPIDKMAFPASGKLSQIINAALEAANPAEAVRKHVHLSKNMLDINGTLYDLEKIQRIFLIGIGKASVAMAQGLLDVLGARISGGVVIQKQEVVGNMGLAHVLQVVQGSHPLPDEKSVNATRAAVSIASQCTQEDLVICLISGGGSALMTLPVDQVSLAEVQQLTQLLLFRGAEIHEMNTLRKHLDQVKGGGLARLIYPAQLVTLILSDVIGSPLDVIASGPCVPDPSRYEDAYLILKKYDLLQKAAPGVLHVIENGLAGKIPETLKPGDPVFKRTQNVLVANNQIAAETALAKAQELGFNAMLLTSYLHGEARHAGAFLAGILKQVVNFGQPLQRPACIIAGGETTVIVKGRGVGGRNLELALGAVQELGGLEKVIMISLATDGEDGPTDAAGAWVTGDTYRMGEGLGLSSATSLKNNDSYHYFEKAGSLLKTGATGTNVNDLVFLFAT
jgi:hydroxypyruvate reductase